MNYVNYSDNRKIDPSRRPIGDGSANKPDGTIDDNDRVEIGPTPLAFEEWEAAGLEAPHLPTMRQFRLDRIVANLAERGYGGALLFDPLNIRYATDTTNMQLWNTHNPFRACFVAADGYMIVFDFKASDLLTGFNPLVRETRGGASMFYFVNGTKTERDAKIFAGEIDDLLRTHAGSNRRLAVDKIQIHGLRALEALGLEIEDGEELMELTRVIKGPDEVKAMRCAIHACEAALYEMEKYAQPGVTENDVWSVLHAENIRRGGEWIETRIMASGPRTNPWFQECGPRVIQNNELLGFDTDLVGCYGMCVDISRTWFVGDGEPTAEQRRLYTEAYEQIMENTAILRPGMHNMDIVRGGRLMPDEFKERQYSVKMHGVGLCDEWPCIYYPENPANEGYDFVLEPGMMLCVESYVGAVGGKEGVKLENQVMITEDGVENMTNFPFAANLIN